MRPGGRALIEHSVDEGRARGVLAFLYNLRGRYRHYPDAPLDRLVQTELRVVLCWMRLTVLDKAGAVGAAERGAQRFGTVEDQLLGVPRANFGERGRQEPFQTVGTDQVLDNCPSTCFQLGHEGLILEDLPRRRRRRREVDVEVRHAVSVRRSTIESGARELSRRWRGGRSAAKF